MKVKLNRVSYSRRSSQLQLAFLGEEECRFNTLIEHKPTRYLEILVSSPEIMYFLNDRLVFFPYSFLFAYSRIRLFAETSVKPLLGSTLSNDHNLVSFVLLGESTFTRLIVFPLVRTVC